MNEKQAFYAKHVNGAWQYPNGVPKLTGPEAVKAARLLYRFIVGRPSTHLKARVTSGNRNTWVRNNELVVNPDKGWREFVHELSHYLHYKTHPQARPHDYSHAYVEARMVKHVIEQGWLDGKLKPKERAAKPKPDRDTVERARIEAAIKRWNSKALRAKNALRKLERRRRYYERKAQVPTLVPSSQMNSPASPTGK